MVNLKELIMILDLHRQGLSVSAIADQTGPGQPQLRLKSPFAMWVPREQTGGTDR